MDDEAEAPLTSEETVGPTEKVETVPSFRPGIKRVRSSNDRIVALLEARRGKSCFKLLERKKTMTLICFSKA